MFNLFGNKLKKAVQKGATIIDLRAAASFDQGRVPGSINIPLDRIPISIGRIKAMSKPIILCSNYTQDIDKATRLLKAEGINEILHGGNWQSLLKKI